MKKFLLKICVFILAFILAIICFHVEQIWVLKSEMDSVYSLTSEQDILFLGSSLIGCGILESPAYGNKVIWLSQTPDLNAKVRLLELERRQQLDHVKILVLPYYFDSYRKFNKEAILWGLYQELPVAWRYYECFPVTPVELITYIASNLRPSLPLKVTDRAPLDRLPIVKRSVVDQHKFWRALETDIKTFNDKDIPKWSEDAYLRNMSEIKTICGRHGIKFVCVEMPILPEFESRLSKSILDDERRVREKLKAMGITFLQPSDESRYTKECFFDKLHLMSSGAECLTVDIITQLHGLLGVSS